MRFLLGGSALFAALAAGCGAGAPVSGEGSGTTQEPIAGGTLDAGDPAVFEEFTNFSGNVSSCTANLIAPNVLLTARHCIAKPSTEDVICGTSVFGDPIAGSSTVSTPDAMPGDSSLFYRGSDVRVPSTGDGMCGNDVALIILQSSIPSTQVTPLIPRIDQPVQDGEQYVAVGYGLDAQGNQNPGRMVLDDLSVHCLSDECEQPYGVAPTEFMGQAGVCSGDSGGPALDADGKIMGIVSRGADPCVTPIYSEISPWRDFITQTVLEAAQTAGYRAPYWAYSGSTDIPADARQPGESCTNSSQCYPGSVCYYASDPSKAACTEVCNSSAQCDGGETCTLGYQTQGGGLCLNPATSAGTTGNTGSSSGQSQGADQGCSLSAPSTSHDGFGRLAMLGFGFGVFGVRRKHAAGRQRTHQAC